MTAVAHLVAHPELPHGPLRIGFNPDEEVGHGHRLLRHRALRRRGGVHARRLDRRRDARRDVLRRQLHRHDHRRARSIPAWGKNRLVNALKLAAQVLARLPRDYLARDDGRARGIRPRRRDRTATPRSSRCEFIVRDHDDALLEQHVALLREILDEVAASEPRARSTHEVIQYRNMRNELAQAARVVDRAERRSAASGSSRADADPRRHRRVAADREGPADAEPLHGRAPLPLASASGAACTTWGWPLRRSSSSAALWAE